VGVSTNAYLFYGYCWQDEDYDFETDIDEVVKAMLVGRGMTDPWKEHYVGEQPYENYKAWAATPQGSVEEAAWYAAQEEAKAELGVDWGSHCSNDYSIPYLHIPQSQTTAYRGTAQPITEDLSVDPKWRERLDTFLSSQNIEPPEGENQPGWWLASYWG
jgi:hypothetical protein